MEVFEKIIEKLEELQNYACFPTEWVNEEQSKIHSYYANKLTEILKLTEQYNNGWIPCSSGVFPKRSNSYCVTKMCENDGNPTYETCHEIFWTNDNKWDCERDEDCEWRVIAWKEKDKPYQPEGE